MHAFEFETCIGQDGNIHVQERFRYAYGRLVRLVLLLPDTPEAASESAQQIPSGGDGNLDRLQDHTNDCRKGEPHPTPSRVDPPASEEAKR